MFGEAFGEPETYRSAPPGDAWLADKLGKPHIIVLAALAGEQVVGGILAYELEKLGTREEVLHFDIEPQGRT